MTLRARLRRVLAPTLKRSPAVWDRVVRTDQWIERTRHSVARTLPVLIRPEPRRIEIAITAYCNLRCVGCRYGRDFMPGSSLPLPVVKDLLDDCVEVGVWDVRFYGGEPLLHPDLPAMVGHAASLGLQMHVTTNATLLGRRIDDLYAAGLRNITMGYYGTEASYDAYVQRKAKYAEVEKSVARVRERYGDSVSMRINWLLMRPSCNLEDLNAAVAFAERHGMSMQIDLVHYSLPYFTEGPDRMLQFRPEDRPAIDTIVGELLRLKQEKPDLIGHSLEGLRSIPDWLLLGPDMRVPCDSHQMLWVGADGTVQQCYVTFELGNLHDNRLPDLLFTKAHRQAARGSFELSCPNCHCHYDQRIRKHTPSAAKYASPP